MNDEQTPKCDKCGAPVTTGAMALLCPLRTKCELWPAGMTEADMGIWREIIPPYEARK